MNNSLNFNDQLTSIKKKYIILIMELNTSYYYVILTCAVFAKIKNIWGKYLVITKYTTIQVTMCKDKVSNVVMTNML